MSEDAPNGPATPINREARSPAAEVREELPWLRRGPQETRRLVEVTRAVQRAQTRALVFEFLASFAVDSFAGSDTRPPRFLLKIPGAGSFAADLQDVAPLAAELRELARNERVKVSRLVTANVLVDAADVDRPGPHRGPAAPVPPGEEVRANPEYRGLGVDLRRQRTEGDT